jgi:hypothetical protein
VHEFFKSPHFRDGIPIIPGQGMPGVPIARQQPGVFVSGTQADAPPTISMLSQAHVIARVHRLQLHARHSPGHARSHHMLAHARMHLQMPTLRCSG